MEQILRQCTRTTLGIMVLGAVCGCSLQLNERTGLISAPAPPALQEAPQSSLSDEPSVTRGHDRRHWEPVTIHLPYRQTEHHPMYVSEILVPPRSPRATGAYPSATSALGLEPHSSARSIESPMNIVHAGFLIVRAPFEMIFAGRWPWIVERGPRDSYARRGVDPARSTIWHWFDIDEKAAGN